MDDRVPLDRVVLAVLAACVVLLHVAVNLFTVYVCDRDRSTSEEDVAAARAVGGGTQLRRRLAAR